MLLEGDLQPGEASFVGEAFDRRDLPACSLADGGEATAHLPTVDQHGARTAVACVAADLCSGEAELVTQDVGKARYGRRVDLEGFAVDVEFQSFALRLVSVDAPVHAQAPASVRRTTVSAASMR